MIAMFPKLLILVIGLLVVLMPAQSHAELNCNPNGDGQPFSTENDKFFKDSVSNWATITNRRDIEGSSKDACIDFRIEGYEGFPTKKCTYKAADAGDPTKPLSAQVVVLNPSARQLASWSVHACRLGGASDAMMQNCLSQIFEHVKGQNGAQFPVVGSIVESECNSSKKYSGCHCLKDGHPALAPRNTLFRDGVSISYQSLAHWDPDEIPNSTYEAMFDTKISDQDIPNDEWYTESRVSGAEREDWMKWRSSSGKLAVPDGIDPRNFDLNGRGWGDVSRIVHQTACKSEGNELFDALVFTRGWAK
jgi:hypothetical protein